MYDSNQMISKLSSILFQSFTKKESKDIFNHFEDHSQMKYTKIVWPVVYNLSRENIAIFVQWEEET